MDNGKLANMLRKDAQTHEGFVVESTGRNAMGTEYFTVEAEGRRFVVYVCDEGKVS